MRALSPPPVLLPGHRSQLLRLSDARSLAARLRAAVGASDSGAVARLLLRFRDVYATSGLDVEVQRAAVRAYRERLQADQRRGGGCQTRAAASGTIPRVNRVGP